MLNKDTIRNFIIISAAIVAVYIIPVNGQSAANIKKHAQYEFPLSAPTILGLTLLESTFSDAARIIGPAATYRTTDEEEAPVQVCYSSEVKGDNTSLILESNYTGAWVSLSGYRLTSIPSDKKRTCTASQLVTRDLKVLNGHIWLGMTKKEVIASLGKPGTRNFDNLSKDELPKNDDPNHWIYLTTWSIPFTEADKKAEEKTFGANSLGENPHWDAWNDVELKFMASKLVEIYVNHGVSN